MGITYDRIQVLHFPPQIHTEYLTILAGFSDEVQVSAFGTLMVFQWQKAIDVEEYRGVWNLVVKRHGLRDEAQLYDDENLRMVLQGKAVIVSDRTTMLYHASRTCRRHLAAGRYYFAKESTFPTQLAMAVDRSTDPTLRQFIDERVSWLFENGVLTAWIEKQLGDWQSCLLGHSEEKYSALSLSDIQSVFFVFLTFASSSIAVFIGELLIGGKKYPVTSRQY
ncbi:hypothetical protein MTO96_032902 [Rhipicephalus appendiculatus]